MSFVWEHGHDPTVGTRPLGRVVNWEIGTDRRSYCEIEWDDHEVAQSFKKSVDNGIISNVSIRYMVHEAVERDGCIVCTRWEPIHASLVSDPADATVGVGRSLESPGDEGMEKETEVNITINIGTSEGEDEDDEEEMGEEIPILEGASCNPLYKSMMGEKETPGGTMAEIDINELRSQEKERQRSIRAMGDTYGKAIGAKATELVETLIDSDKSVEEARSAFAQEVERALGKQAPLGGFSHPVQPRDYLPGFGEKEDRQYSFLRLLRSMIPDFPDEYGKNCFERDVSQQIAQQMGGDPNTIRIPTRNLSRYGQRDIQQVGSATLGGNLVAQDYRADMWIEALRNKAVVFQLGAKFITGLKGNVAFPKETGVSTASWINENEPAPETNYTVGQLTLTPKTVAAYTTLTRTLLLQSTPDAEMIARDNLLKAIALKIDQTALSGSGVAPEPKGIVNYSIKGLATALGNDGGYLTYASLVELMGAIEASNANLNGLKWLMNSKTMARLMITPLQASGVEGNFIIKDGATSMVGMPFAVSNQCRSNLTKGNGTGLSEIYLGDWSQLYVGEWEGLSLNVNYNGTTFRTGGAEVVAFQTLDMNLAHEESFAAVTEVKTA
jgi:HK97 family phage major capsid protein